MKRLPALMMIVSLSALALLPAALLAADKDAKGASAATKADEEGFIPLFNGKDLTGWKANENPQTFKVEDGNLVVHGPRAHLFYVGPVQNHNFKDFHLRLEAMTFPKANSGVYFHTEFQPDGWPAKGFECQVNATQSDRKKTGGLYSVKDVMDNAPNKDNQWFTYDIIVKGNQVTLKVNGQTTAEWTQPDNWQPPRGMEGRRIGSGTFALQGHDPDSKVMYRNIRVKPLE